MDHQIAALSCTSRCVIFAFLHLLLRLQLERLRFGRWLAGRRTGEKAGVGGEGGRVAWLHSEEAEDEETWCRCQASTKYCLGI
jgi:hypothetical protein